MIAYIMDGYTFKPKAIAEFEEYDFVTDIEFNERSTIVTNVSDVVEGDWVLCKDGDKQLFFGIFENYEYSDGTYKYHLRQPECFFDQKIVVGNYSIAAIGVENFLINEIYANWISSGDAMLDRTYISIWADTTTRLSIEPDLDGLVYNFKTFLGNIREKYDIKLTWTPTANGLTIFIEKDESPTKNLDCNISSIINLSETYEVSVLAKLNVAWFDGEDVMFRKFYLRTDRTITEDDDDPNRAEGKMSALWAEVETEGEMLQKVYDEFRNNSYRHKITLDLQKGNTAYPVDDYYLGKHVRIKTNRGTKETIVTKREDRSDSGFVSLAFGKLPISLIDKIRRIS